jgi:hypothetical protein
VFYLFSAVKPALFQAHGYCHSSTSCIIRTTLFSNVCSMTRVNTYPPTPSSGRSRSAAAVSSLTLRQISAVLPPEQAWGLWLSRQIVARIMDTFGPSLAGAHVVPVDTRTSDGRRVVG